MRIALTGATGFLGRYILTHLASRGHQCQCWHQASSDRGGLEQLGASVTWVPGTLGDEGAARTLVAGAEAVVHAALYRPGAGFQGNEGPLVTFLERNLLGTIRLVEAARAAGAKRFVFISSCAVHDVILDDRPLDETHPLWPTSHYGAHKAAIEAFVHSYGNGLGYPICALRPTGIYGLAHPPAKSRWFGLISAVCRGDTVECRRGGKEVHAADVARAVEVLLEAEGITGQAYNCYDRYISEYEVATIAKQIAGSASKIQGAPAAPRHQIDTRKIQSLGMTFGGPPLLEKPARALVDAAGSAKASEGRGA